MHLSVLMGMLMFMRVRMRLVLRVRVRGAFVDTEFHAFDVLPLLPFEVHVKVADLQLGKLPLESGRLHAEIDERADRHVAADAGDAVEEEGFHVSGRIDRNRPVGNSELRARAAGRPSPRRG